MAKGSFSEACVLLSTVFLTSSSESLSAVLFSLRAHELSNRLVKERSRVLFYVSLTRDFSKSPCNGKLARRLITLSLQGKERKKTLGIKSKFKHKHQIQKKFYFCLFVLILSRV